MVPGNVAALASVLCSPTAGVHMAALAFRAVRLVARYGQSPPRGGWQPGYGVPAQGPDSGRGLCHWVSGDPTAIC